MAESDKSVSLESAATEENYSEGSDEELETSETSSSTVVSFLSCLKAPKKSELSRKRKIFTNPSRHSCDGPRKKRPSCSSNPKTVTPAQ